MGLKDVFKDIKKNVKSLDETMDHTDQEIDHFGRVLDSTEEGLAKFTHCISQAEVCVQKINHLTNHGEELVSRLDSLVNIVENREMIIMSFYGAIIVTFLISILIIENLISALIYNNKHSEDRTLSFFGSVFDYLFISVICFGLRVFQLILFTIVTYSSLESVKKTILKKVEIEINATSSTNGTPTPQESNSITETPRKTIPTITVATTGESTPKTLSSNDVTPVTEVSISSLANNVSSSTRTSRSDLTNVDVLSNSDLAEAPLTPTLALSDALKTNLESALQIANSIAHSTATEENQSSSTTNAL